MSRLPHDDYGFLTGTPVQIQRESRESRYLAAIRADVRAIRQAVANAGALDRIELNLANGNPFRTTGPQPTGASATQQVAEPSLRRSLEGAPQVAARSGDVATPLRASAKAIERFTAEATRDGRGRFTKGQKEPDPKNPKPDDDEARGGIGSRVAASAADAAASASDVDPTVRAMGEVAAPLKRGYDAVFGDSESRKSGRWFRRIFGEIRLFRREETLHNKIANKTLKKIEAKPSGGGEGGSGGLLAILGAIAAVIGSALPKFLIRSPVLGSLTKGFGKAFGFGKQMFAGAKGFKGLLRRVPVLGALLAGFGAGSDILDSESDESLSRRDKDRRAGKAVGGALGTLGGAALGAALGTAILPGVGTVIGGVLGAFLGDQGGQIVGEKVGEWVNDLRAYDIPGKVVAAFTEVGTFFKTGWLVVQGLFTDAVALVNKATQKVSSVIEALTGGVNDAMRAVFAWIKEKTGVDVEALARKAGAAVTQAKVVVVATAGRAVDAVGDKAAQAIGIAKKTAVDAGRWAMENTTPGRVATNINKRWAEAAKAIGGSPGRASLEKQLDLAGMTAAEKAALMGNVAVESGFVAKSENMDYSKTSNDRIRSIFKTATKGVSDDDLTRVKQDPRAFGDFVYKGIGGFDYRGRGHIQLTGKDNYARYSKMLFGDDRLVKNPDLANDPEIAARIAVAYQKDRVRPLAAKMFGKSYDQLNPEQIQQATTQAIAGEKSDITTGHLKSVAEAKSLYANAFMSAQERSIVVSIPPVSVPSAPAPPKIEPAPLVREPLASNSGDKKTTVFVAGGDVGQDVSSRPIAHIVTGGMAG